MTVPYCFLCFCPFRALFINYSNASQGAASLYPGLCASCPFRALLLIFVHQTVHLFNELFLFLTTTETTGTTGRTGATEECHKVTYNRDNKISVANSLSRTFV